MRNVYHPPHVSSTSAESGALETRFEKEKSRPLKQIAYKPRIFVKLLRAYYLGTIAA